MVAAPFSMMRWPTAVEPVNEIMSTLGESVSSSPIRWSDDVTTLTTPAGMSVFSAMRRPRSVAFHGVSGAGLSTTVLPVASAWPSLCEVTSNGKFHGTMAPTTPTGSRQIRRESTEPWMFDGVGQHRLPLELVDLLGRPGEGLGERRVELRAVGRHARAADLEDELLAQLLLLGLERLVQLLEALLAEGVVGRPVGLVEGAAGGVDGALHLGRRGVGDLADDLLGGRD